MAHVEAPENQPFHHSLPSANFAEFVTHNFIPEYVAVKRAAGRAYLRAILKHVISPDLVAKALAVKTGRAKDKLKAIPGWPYLDGFRLGDITAAMVQDLSLRALQLGYSTQTAAHIRNVIRYIFSHAIRTGRHAGDNPAESVTLPAMTRKPPHALSLQQLENLLQTMHYPEKYIALFAILTDMSVAEICGLQWGCMNLLNVSRMVEQEFIPPRTIAVRNQNYRGEFTAVTGRRKRFVRIPALLCSFLRDLKERRQFTESHDFVLVTRNGTPIYPENIAARRLKSIGKSFDMPWLSWSVFRHTRIALRTEYGRDLQTHLEKILPRPRSGPL